jgi:hypothetical protein
MASPLSSTGRDQHPDVAAESPILWFSSDCDGEWERYRIGSASAWSGRTMTQLALGAAMWGRRVAVYLFTRERLEDATCRVARGALAYS